MTPTEVAEILKRISVDHLLKPDGYHVEQVENYDRWEIHLDDGAMIRVPGQLLERIMHDCNPS